MPTNESTDIVVTDKYAYIVNAGDNAVLVLDRPGNVAVGFIGVGRGPSHAVISPDQNRLYVVNSVDRTVSVINTTTNTLIDTNPGAPGVNSIPLPGGLPNGLVVSRDGGRLYVTDWGGTVSVIDTATYTRIDTNTSAAGVNDIAVGGNLLGSVLSPDGRTLYVASYPDNGGHGQGSIAVIDTVTGAAVAPPINFGLAAYTDDLAISPDGTRLYVLHSPTDPVPGYEPAGISVIDTATNAVIGTTIVVIDPALGSARSMVLGPDGTVAFVANDNETVSVVDVTTHTPLYVVDTFAEPAGGNRSIALSPDGRWMYVVDEDDGSVYPRTVSSP